MGSYTDVKKLIISNIKANGQREITGPILQDVLLNMLENSSEAYEANKEYVDNKIADIPIEKGSGYQSMTQKVKGNAATGQYSSAFGLEALASGNSAIAEGWQTKSNGVASHAEGVQTEANGNASHTEGQKTITQNKAEHAEGTWNLSIKDKTIHTVGIGTSDTDRKNAEEIHSTGDKYVIGVGGYDGTNSQAEGIKTVQEVVEDVKKKLDNRVDLTSEQNITAKKTFSGGISMNNTKILDVAYPTNDRDAVNKAYVDSVPVSQGVERYSVIQKNNSNKAEAPGASAFGRENTANGNYSHAEGFQTKASGQASHTEGTQTQATNDSAHAEGYKTVASRYQSHAEGNQTYASGVCSHTEGFKTKTTNKGEHAEGLSNISIEGKTVHTVGIGSTEDNVENRKNAEEIHLNGDKYVYGIGGYDGTNSQTDGIKTVQEVVAEAANAVKIKYTDLKSLRDAGMLAPGQQYRITDYTCTTTQDNTQSAGHVFDIIVTADSESVLNEEANATLHEGDTYFTNSDLNAWKIWYCLDNDTTRFAWADATETNGKSNGRGVIYRMIDEFGNDCPYDFKNIQFKHPNNPTIYPYYYYTFASDNVKDNTDNSISIANNCYSNVIKEYLNDSVRYLNRIIFVGDGSNNTIPDSFGSVYTIGGCYNNTFENDCFNNTFEADCNSNTFGVNCSNNIFGTGCYSNTFGNDCDSNTFRDGCYNNSFGNDCDNNSFGNDCDSNTFRDGCYNNSFGNNCANNSFGEDCDNNSFGEYCDNNSFRNDCYSNAFIDYCDNNSFGNNCGYNHFGDYCSCNSFGNDYYSNTFIDYCDNNSFGNNCRYNSFGNDCCNNSFGNDCCDINFALKRYPFTEYAYYQHNHFGDGCQYILFKGTETASSSAQVQNYNFAQGLKGTSLEYLTIDGKRNRTYETYISKDTDGAIKESVIAEKLDKVIEISYNDLVTLRGSSKLVPGQQYRITDYTCTTTQANTKSAGHIFDIIVTADDESTLNEEARAALHTGDEYFSGCNLNAWKLWYCLDNNTNRFAWADGTNGKGVIYRMIDEWNNDIPYDFKNIQFKHPNDTTTYPYYYYTFASGNVEDNTDNSLLIRTYSNRILSYITLSKQTINKILFIGSDCYLNTFDNNCYNNTFSNNCYNNTFGNYCYNNVFGSFYYNNSLGNDCYYNVFGNDCGKNTFGNGYDYNSLGNYCYDNVFENNCGRNTFGAGCMGNTFENSCTNIVFAEDSNATSKFQFYQHNHFGNGCKYILFKGAETAGWNEQVQNYNFAQGLQGTSNAYLTIDGVRNRSFETKVAMNSNGELKIYCEADLIK